MNETAILLEALHDEIFQESAEIVGRPEIVGDALTFLNGKAHLTVEVRHDPGAHPSLAHCHIVTHIAAEQSGHLDACIVGIDDDPAEALRSAARKWTELVGSPVFSLLHGREVLRGVHFDGRQKYGVSGCHGFVGPLSADLVDSSFELKAFSGTQLFDYAAEMAPPGVLHLAKVTLQADGKGGWNRNLEIDGHLASHADTPWNNGPPAPQQAIVRQFAIFHYGGRAEQIEERQNIDDAIRQFVAVFPLAHNFARVSDAMKMKGINEELVYNVLAFTPLAFARALLKPMGRRSRPST